MAIEIERKFVVPRNCKLAHLLNKLVGIHIQQGYLILGNPELRVRKKGQTYFETYKDGRGMKREEIEEEICETDFLEMWPLTKGCRVEKIRFPIPYRGLLLEVDYYLGVLEGIICLECEFGSEEDAIAFTLPLCALGSVEVTNDFRYKNQKLAKITTREEALLLML